MAKVCLIVQLLESNRNHPFACCSLEEGDAVMDAYLLQCINHVYSAAALIKKNNDRLKAAGDGAGDNPRDQGFTRAKVRTPLCCSVIKPR